MTNDDIIKLAREAGLQGSEFWPGYFKRRYAAAVKFATLVTQAEREACAKACEARDMGDCSREDMEARRCAAAIRARKHVVDANKNAPGLALDSGEFVPAEKIADWAAA